MPESQFRACQRAADRCGLTIRVLDPYVRREPVVLFRGYRDRISHASDYGLADWEQVRRPGLLMLFRREVFGVAPPRRADLAFAVVTRDPKALGGRARRSARRSRRWHLRRLVARPARIMARAGGSVEGLDVPRKTIPRPNRMPLVNDLLIDGPIAYHIRSGGHGLFLFDWKLYLDHADAFFRHK